MQCISPIWLEKYGRFVPCGRCTSCRVNYSTMWSTRLMQELAYYKSALFLTLSYEEKHLIYSIETRKPTLYKRHWQLFVKRLRKVLGRDRKIRYFACGEYGEEGGRPHYHAIIFGLSPKQKDRALIRKCWPYCQDVGRYFGTVTQDSCRYCTDYIAKAAKSKEDKDAYKRVAMEPPFCVISNGIGERFCLEHKDLIEKNLSTVNSKGLKVPVPRYYTDKLNIKRQSSSNYYTKLVLKHKGEILKHYPQIAYIYDMPEKDLRAYMPMIMSTKVNHPVQAAISDWLTKYYVPARQAKARKSAELTERIKNKKIF